MPRTGPSHDTVPVSPPDVNVPDEGATDSPGASVTVVENVQCVWVSAAPAAPPSPMSQHPTRATTTATTAATDLLPMPWTVTYGDAPDQAGGPLRPPPGSHGPGPGP